MRSRFRGFPLSDVGAAAFCAAAFAAVSWALYGYTFGTAANQAFYLPGVLARLQPSLFAGDPVVPVLSRSPTFFWGFLAFIASKIGLERAAWLFWVLSRALGGAAVYGAARALKGSRAEAAFSTALALFSWELFCVGPLAGDSLFKPYLDQSSFAWPAILAAVALWLSGRRTAGLLLLGALASVNVLLSALVACWLGVSSFLDGSRRWRELAAGAALWLAAALPILIVLKRTGGGGDIELLAACNPQTFVSASWPWEKWLGFCAQAGLWAALFARGRRPKELFALLGSAVFLWAVAITGGLWAPLHPLLRFQFLRLDVAVAWLALAACGGVLAPCFGDGRSSRFLPAVTAAWALCCPMGGPLLAAWSALLIASIGRRRMSAVAGVVGTLYGLVSLWQPSGSLLHLPPSVSLMALALGTLTALSSTREGISLSAGARGVVLAGAALGALLPMGRAAALRAAQTPASESSSVEAWAQTTAEGSLFIVPPSWSGFRLRSRRAVYAEWTDCALATWDSAAAAQWQRRMEALGVDWSRFPARRARESAAWEAALVRRVMAPLPGGLPQWGPGDVERLAALARRAGARYLVAPLSAGLPWRPAFASEEAAVYAMPPGPDVIWRRRPTAGFGR